MPEGEIFKPGTIAFVHSVRDLLREVRIRPELYLNIKSLTCLKCFLDGYDFACNLHWIGEAGRLADDVPWQRFSEWLAERYDKVGWSVDWRWLLVENSSTEEEAFDRFFELLKEFEDRT